MTVVGVPQLPFSSFFSTTTCSVSSIQNLWLTCKETTSNFVDYLQLPSTQEYISASTVAFQDVVVATKSVSNLSYLTCRPLWLLLVLLCRGLWTIMKFLSKHLFRGAFMSLQKGWKQTQVGCIYYWKWQRSLSRTALMMELAFVSFCIICFMLRRYIQKKKYVERLRRWYTIRKRKTIQQYNKVVTRIARTSLFLAMCLPHALFVGTVVTIKLVFPRLVTFIACETYGTSVLSFWYPLMWTISILHQYRGRQHAAIAHKDSNTRGDARLATTPASKGTRTGMYPKTTPNRRTTTSRTGNATKKAAPSPMVQRWIQAAMTPASIRRLRSHSSKTIVSGSKEEEEEWKEASFWLKYWIVYTVVLAVSRLLYLTPLVGRIIGGGPRKAAGTLEELQFIFYVWLLGLEMTQTTTTDEREHDFENRPLELLYGRLLLGIQKMYMGVSTAIPDSLWETLVSKVKAVLELCVLVKLVSTSTKDKLVHYLEEGQSLLPPAITLFMPGFTEYGVLYVNTIVPAYKSSQAFANTSSRITTISSQSIMIMKSLQYWVLNALWSAVLSWWSGLLWWIPFSSHLIFVSWCHLQMPKSVEGWYKVLEDELMAFGLVQRWDSNNNFELDMENTASIKVWRALVKSLPSATEDDEQQQEEGSQKEEEKDDSSTTAVANEDNDDYNGTTIHVTKSRRKKKVIVNDGDDPMDIDYSDDDGKNKENSVNGSSSSSDEDENDSRGSRGSSSSRPVRRSARRRQPLSSAY